MDKIIAANWKMNNSFSDIKPFVKYIKKNQKNRKNLVVCVPSVMLAEFAKQAKGVCETGAQNCYFEAKGAYTGEISASMVKSTGANYTLVGHSERRQLFGETNEMLNTDHSLYGRIVSCARVLDYIHGLYFPRTELFQFGVVPYKATIDVYYRSSFADDFIFSIL